jgi:hypothetical protein
MRFKFIDETKTELFLIIEELVGFWKGGIDGEIEGLIFYGGGRFEVVLDGIEFLTLGLLFFYGESGLELFFWKGRRWGWSFLLLVLLLYFHCFLLLNLMNFGIYYFVMSGIFLLYLWFVLSLLFCFILFFFNLLLYFSIFLLFLGISYNILKFDFIFFLLFITKFFLIRIIGDEIFFL